MNPINPPSRSITKARENALSPADTSEGDAAEEPFDPDLTRIMQHLHGPSGTISFALMGLLILASFYTLYAAKAFFLPVIVALMLNFLLSPVVSFLRRLRVPAPLGAALVLLGVLATLTLGGFYLSDAASGWIDNAPQRLRQAEHKLRGVTTSLEKLEKTTEELEKITNGSGPAAGQEVTVRKAPLSDTLMSQTQELFVGGVVMFFLLYFLLAADDLFLRKLVQALPRLRHKRNAVAIIRHTEADLSRYFLTVTLINAGLGAAVAGALYLLGMPNPLLWGTLAAFLNFIPYVGGLVGILVIGLAAVVSFDTLGEALWPPLIYLLLNTVEAYVFTPVLLGRRLLLNPVAVFISIIFWGWIWGVPGAILAVPLLVSFKIACDNIEMLAAVGAFLGR